MNEAQKLGLTLKSIVIKNMAGNRAKQNKEGMRVSNYFSKNKRRAHPFVLSFVVFFLMYGLLNFGAGAGRG